MQKVCISLLDFELEHVEFRSKSADLEQNSEKFNPQLKRHHLINFYDSTSFSLQEAVTVSSGNKSRVLLL